MAKRSGEGCRLFSRLPSLLPHQGPYWGHWVWGVVVPRRRGLDTFSAQKCGAYAVRSASDCRHRAESVRVRIGTTYLRGSPQNPNEEEEEERKRERERDRERGGGGGGFVMLRTNAPRQCRSLTAATEQSSQQVLSIYLCTTTYVPFLFRCFVQPACVSEAPTFHSPIHSHVHSHALPKSPIRDGGPMRPEGLKRLPV